MLRFPEPYGLRSSTSTEPRGPKRAEPEPKHPWVPTRWRTLRGSGRRPKTKRSSFCSHDCFARLQPEGSLDFSVSNHGGRLFAVVGGDLRRGRGFRPNN